MKQSKFNGQIFSSLRITAANKDGWTHENFLAEFFRSAEEQLIASYADGIIERIHGSHQIVDQEMKGFVVAIVKDHGV